MSVRKVTDNDMEQKCKPWALPSRSELSAMSPGWVSNEEGEDTSHPWSSMGLGNAFLKELCCTVDC